MPFRAAVAYPGIYVRVFILNKVAVRVNYSFYYVSIIYGAFVCKKQPQQPAVEPAAAEEEK